MVEFTKVDGKDKGDIRIFALSTCMWCKKTKKFFKDNNIAYSYVDVDLLSGDELNECLTEQLKYTGEETYPLIAIGEDDYILGYNKERLDELIGE